MWSCRVTFSFFLLFFFFSSSFLMIPRLSSVTFQLIMLIQAMFSRACINLKIVETIPSYNTSCRISLALLFFYAYRLLCLIFNQDISTYTQPYAPLQQLKTMYCIQRPQRLLKYGVSRFNLQWPVVRTFSLHHLSVYQSSQLLSTAVSNETGMEGLHICENKVAEVFQVIRDQLRLRKYKHHPAQTFEL